MVCHFKQQETDEDRNLVLMNLFYLKDIIAISLKFYERLDIKGKQFKKHIKDLIQNYELKIEVKEYLINYEKNKNEKGELNKLEKLVEKYDKCESVEIEDLKKLLKIIITVKPQNKFIIDKKEKEEFFLYIFKKMPQDSCKKFFYLFDEYNPNEDKYNDTDVNNFIYETNMEKRDEFLIILRGEFQKLCNDEKNINKKKVYESILIYLNYLGNKRDAESLFDDIE